MTCTTPSGIPARRALRGAPWLLLAAAALAAAAALGCSGEVTVPPRGEVTVPPGGPIDPPATGEDPCPPDGEPEPPDPAPIAVTAVKSAAFIGDTLHLEATVEGVPRYLVLALDERGGARAVAIATGLLGPANLVEGAPGIHVRLRAGDAGNPVVDLVATEDPEAPELVSSAELSGVVDGGTPFSVSAGRLFFCMRPQVGDGEPAALVAVDVLVGREPLVPEVITSPLCAGSGEVSYAAAGATWISWSQPAESATQDVSLYTVGAEGAAPIVNHGYNATGVHRYGAVLAAATSEQRAVFDPENRTYFLLISPSGGAQIAWASLDVGAERRLLGVVDTTLYLATEEGVRAVDIADIERPETLPYQATIEGFEGALRLLAASPRFLAVVDDRGTLFLVPREGSGTVGPLVAFPSAGDAAPAGPCED
ncbi:uncharacterized protein SOCE26_038970 [Sorangium cellulosum]|uniref:Secreted protein n=1 Tax=Sorangium cellulosum TaxID=56 RepID=A0A2L0ET57_SORCE|nr:hypothetical protein [Sorangium cellulosum]AUX42464.1 uncharacterized protein SOCE26_038970 [Sorangium cellulosum]